MDSGPPRPPFNATCGALRGGTYQCRRAPPVPSPSVHRGPSSGSVCFGQRERGGAGTTRGTKPTVLAHAGAERVILPGNGKRQPFRGGVWLNFRPISLTVVQWPTVALMGNGELWFDSGEGA